MFLLRLALRNLTRHKRRTLITGLIIAIAIFIYILTEGLMLGITELSFRNIINLESGHLQVMEQAYWEEREKMELDNLLSPEAELVDEIKNLPGFANMTKQLKFAANLNNGIDELPVSGIGIDLESFTNVFSLEKHLVSGKMPAPGKFQAVLGTKLAELMDLAVGDYIVLLVRTEEETFNTIDAEITGLYNSPHPTLNESTVYVPIEIAQNSLNVGNKFSHYVIRLTDRSYTAAARSALQAEITSNHAVYSWRDLSESVMTMAQTQSVETQVILAIILVIAAVGIVNTIILSALERMEELGMMKAMGMKKWEIIVSFMVEAAGIGIIGGIIGIAAGIIGIGIFNLSGGISLAAMGAEDLNYGLPIKGSIYAGWSNRSAIFVFVYGLVVSVLASYLPARWAARKDPVKSIYHR